MMRTKCTLSVLVLLPLGGPAFGHHSAAMFDQQKQVTLMGTVKLFQMTNPHCWIQVLVPSDNGTEEWSIEMGGPPQLLRFGWKPGSLKPGDKITVIARPMKDGSKAGGFVSATGSDGKLIGRQP